MKVRPEAHFVALCARERGAVLRGQLEKAAAAVVDWDLVADLAIRHRMAAYLLDADVDLPRGVADTLRASAFSRQALTMLLDSELERVAQALQAAGVPVLVLKGPALARELYPDRRLRPYADLDLTVHEQDEHRAAAVLLESSYAEHEYASGAVQHARGADLHDCGGYHRWFAGANGRVLIELHLDPLQLGVRTACEAERWARAVPISGLSGLLMLGPEDQVVQLSVHAHKHGFNRLIWHKDLDLLLRRHATSLDWKRIAEIARREGVAGSVWYALELTRGLLDTPLPAAVRELRPSAAVRLLYRSMWPYTRIVNLNGFIRRRSVQLHVGGRWRDMLPSLVLMGRRSLRLRLLAGVVLNR